MPTIPVILSLDTNAYATGDVLAATQEVPLVRKTGKETRLRSVVVIDKDDQGGAFDLVFLRSNVSIGAENAAVALSGANATEVIGILVIAAADYVDLGSGRIATKQPLDFELTPTTGTSIWVAAVSRDAKTYTAAGLQLRLGVEYVSP